MRRSRCVFAVAALCVAATVAGWLTAGAVVEDPAGEESAQPLVQLPDQETILTSRVTVAVTDGGILEVLHAVSSSTFYTGQVEVRRPKPVQVSFSVKDMPIEDVLRGAAGFFGCNLYVLPDRVLLAPESQLLPGERDRVIRSHAGAAGSASSK